MRQRERREIGEARRAREDLGLSLNGPFDDLLRSVEEDAGVPVGVFALPETLAGLYRRRKENSFIFINGSQAVVRQRFTLAHEFGHYRLGHGTVIDRNEDMFGPNLDPQEVEANYFAAEFLAPRQAVGAWMEAQGDPEIGLETIVRFACRFGISAKAARIRFETARMLRSHSEISRLDELIGARKHRDLQWQLGLEEMQDSLSSIERLPRIPQPMEGRARRLYAAGLLDLEEIAQRLQRSVADLEGEFAGIEPTFEEDDF